MQIRKCAVATMTPEELIRGNLKFTSLPAIVAKINPLLNNPNTSAAEIVHVIDQDPVLAARLLKLINSPFYSLPSQVDTLNMAVTISDTRQLRDLVIATTIVNHFKAPPEVDFDMETFWCHSIATGIAARTIALSQNIQNSERLFVGGLLHDIGKMIMSLLLSHETESLHKVNENPALSIDHPEQQIFGFTHGQLANALLASWNFPESISQPILHHHDLKSEAEFKTDTAILHVANVIANNIQAPVSKDDDTILNIEALKILDIDKTIVESYYEDVYNCLDEILDLLYYDLATELTMASNL